MMCAWLSISSYGSIVRPFLRRCPTAVRGLSPQAFGREVRSLGSRPPTVGAATAIAWWECSGCLAYVMMDSVREKEEKEGKTAAIVGTFYSPCLWKRLILIWSILVLWLSLRRLIIIIEFMLLKKSWFTLHFANIGLCLRQWWRNSP